MDLGRLEPVQVTSEEVEEMMGQKFRKAKK
jgi:hypothetical protein